jgi:transcriptional regulator with XRE-family HTH domain
MHMALRIKELRAQRGWTQETLAAKARISRSQLAMIEKGTRPANTLRLEALADALGVSIEALFDTDHLDREFLETIRRLKPEDRAALVRMAEALASKGDQA